MGNRSGSTPEHDAFEDNSNVDDDQTVWHGQGRNQSWYSIDELPNGGYVVYRYRSVQHIGIFDTFARAKRAIGVK